MPTIQNDIFERTTYTRNHQNKRKDRASRYAVVTDLTAGANALNQACDSTAPTTSYPSDPTLPLYTQQATLFHPVRAFVLNTYARGETAIPTRPADELINKDSGTISLPWYAREATNDGTPTFDDRGRPNGIPNYTMYISWNGSLSYENRIRMVPERYSRTIPITQLRMNTILSVDPTEQVQDFQNRTNADDFTLGDVTYPENTIYFHDFEVQSFDTYAGVKYAVSYIFLYRQEEWVRERVKAATTLETGFGLQTGGLEYEYMITHLINMYAEANMQYNDFPTHDQDQQ